MSSAFTKYSLVTPNLPEATCLIELRFESPLASGVNREGSSPPSPVFDLAPRRFIAMARVSWASCEIEPYDIAPVEKRLTMLAIDSTSSTEIGVRVVVSNSKRPRKVMRAALWSSTAFVYRLKTS